MMTTAFDGELHRSSKVPASQRALQMDKGSDFLSGVKKQLRRDYREALGTSLPKNWRF
jgi:hypothetical protein